VIFFFHFFIFNISKSLKRWYFIL